MPHTEKALTNLDFPPTSNLRKAQRLGACLEVDMHKVVCIQIYLETNHQSFTEPTKPRRLRSYNEVIDKAELPSKPFI